MNIEFFIISNRLILRQLLLKQNQNYIKNVLFKKTNQNYRFALFIVSSDSNKKSLAYKNYKKYKNLLKKQKKKISNLPTKIFYC